MNLDARERETIIEFEARRLGKPVLLRMNAFVSGPPSRKLLNKFSSAPSRISTMEGVRMKSALKLSIAAVLFTVAHAFCAEEAKIPDWVPQMPDQKPEVLNVKKLDKGEEVILFFKSSKDPAELAKWYKAEFEKKGFDSTDPKKFIVDNINEDGNKQVNMKTDDGKRAWWFSARQDKGKTETTVSLVYQTKG